MCFASGARLLCHATSFHIQDVPRQTLSTSCLMVKLKGENNGDASSKYLTKARISILTIIDAQCNISTSIKSSIFHNQAWRLLIEMLEQKNM
jgi:hypothetical protein